MRVCVYAGSNPGSNPAYAEATTALGNELAARGIGVVSLKWRLAGRVAVATSASWA